MNQGNPTGSIGVVLNRVHLSGNAIFVSPEVDQPVVPHVATTPVPHRDFALVVPSTGFLLPDTQLLRHIGTGCQISKI
jgi:hypothetical protein